MNIGLQPDDIPKSYRTNKYKTTSSDLSDGFNSSEDAHNGTESDSMSEKTKLSSRAKMLKYLQQRKKTGSNSMNQNKESTSPSNRSFTNGIKKIEEILKGK